MLHKKLRVLLLLLMAASVAVAQEAAKEPVVEQRKPALIEGVDTGDSIFVTLQGCLLQMLEQNFDIRIARISPLIAEQDITAARGIYDPVLAVSMSQENRKFPSADELEIGTGTVGIKTAKEDTSSIQSSLSQKLPSGAVASIEYQFTGVTHPTFPFTGLDPSYDTKTTLRLVQPLLKNVGIFVTEVGIEISISAHRASQSDLEAAILKSTFDTASAYWNLVRAREDYRTEVSSLKRATDFRDLVKQRIDAGALAPKEIYDAEAQVAVEQDALEGARTNILNREEVLKQFMNLKDNSPLAKARLLPVDSPEYQETTINMADAESSAVRLRPEVRSLKESKTRASLTRRYFRNQKLPELNLELAHSWLGLGGDFTDSMSMLGRMNFRERSAKLEFNYPIGNHEAGAQYQQAIFAQEQAVLKIDQERQNVVLEVRTAARGVERTANRVTATRSILKARKEANDAMVDRFNAGKATSFDVVQTLERLAIAEKDVQQALVDRRIALNDFHRAIGDLLVFHNIRPAAPETSDGKNALEGVDRN